jgi:hypothetical protein
VRRLADCPRKASRFKTSTRIIAIIILEIITKPLKPLIYKNYYILVRICKISTDKIIKDLIDKI